MVRGAFTDRVVRSRPAAVASRHPKAVLTMVLLLLLILTGDTAGAVELDPSSIGDVSKGP